MRMLHRYYYTSSNAAKDSQVGTVASTIRTLPCIHEKAFSHASLRKGSKVKLSNGTTTAPCQERIISNPPASIYAGCCSGGDGDETKNMMDFHSSDDSDTCSEMTLSATFSNSSFLSGAVAVGKQQVGGGTVGSGCGNTFVRANHDSVAETAVTRTSSSRNKFKEVSPASNNVAADTSISGKMMGLTLKETMEWRRRVSVSSTIGHGDDARNCNFSSCAVLQQPSRGGEPLRHCSDKERKVVCRDQLPSNKVSDEKCPPEFMIVRAKLKSAKSSTRRNWFASDRGRNSNSRSRMSGDVTTTRRQESPSIDVNSHSSRISDNSNGSSSSRGRSSSSSIISGKEITLGNTISAVQPMETLQSNVQSTIVTVEDSSKTCQGTKCVQDKDIHQKLNALFASRQSHVVAESKKNTIPTVAANNKVDVDHDAIHNDGNTSSKGIALDCNEGKGVTNLIKSDFKSKLNEVFSQRIPSKDVNKRCLVKEMAIVRDTLDQRMVELDGLEQVRNHDTPSKDMVSMKDLNKLTRTTGVESRDDNAAQDVHEDVRDPEPQVANCEKYQKMLKLGLPEAAVRHAMIKDGVDTSLLFADDAGHQSSFCSDNNSKKDPFRRIRLHWDTIPEENVSQGCIWHEIKLDTDIGNLYIEEQEFNKLFQCEVLSLSVLSPRNECSTERVVKVIDPKRANNGGIILARLKMSYEDIANGIATMNDSILTPQQIIGIMEYIPTEDERRSLGNYMRSGRDSSTLCECEKFMLAIMPVQEAKKKLEAMLFKLQYPNSVKQLYQDIDTLSKACDNILESVKLRKTLGVILKVGNRLNLAGMESIKTSASGFTIELLTKLNQVRALDRRTTILQYIVSVIERWNAPLLHIKEELKYVLRTKKIADYESSLYSLENQLNNFVRTAALVEDHDGTSTETGTNPKNVNESTAIGQFVLDATETIYDLQKKHAVFKEKFNDVLIYLAQDKSTKPDKVFGAISVFCHELDTALHTNRNKHRYRKN